MLYKLFGWLIELVMLVIVGAVYVSRFIVWVFEYGIIVDFTLFEKIFVEVIVLVGLYLLINISLFIFSLGNKL